MAVPDLSLARRSAHGFTGSARLLHESGRGTRRPHGGLVLGGNEHIRNEPSAGGGSNHVENALPAAEDGELERGRLLRRRAPRG